MDFQEIIEEMETIDDEVDSMGIALVTTEVNIKSEIICVVNVRLRVSLNFIIQDIKYAGATLNIRKFPALGIFRYNHL